MQQLQPPLLYLNAPSRAATLGSIISALRLLTMCSEGVGIFQREMRRVEERGRERGNGGGAVGEDGVPSSVHVGGGTTVCPQLLEDLSYRVGEMKAAHVRKMRFAARTSTLRPAVPLNPIIGGAAAAHHLPTTKTGNDDDATATAAAFEEFPFGFDVHTAITFGLLRRLRWLLEVNPLCTPLQSSAAAGAGAAGSIDGIQQQQQYTFLGVGSLAAVVHYLVEFGLDGVCGETFDALLRRLHAEMALELRAVGEWADESETLLKALKAEAAELRRCAAIEAIPAMRAAAATANKQTALRDTTIPTEPSGRDKSSEGEEEGGGGGEKSPALPLVDSSAVGSALIEADGLRVAGAEGWLAQSRARSERIAIIAARLNSLLSRSAFGDPQGDRRAAVFARVSSSSTSDAPNPFPFPAPTAMPQVFLTFHSHIKGLRSYREAIGSGLSSLLDKRSRSLYSPHTKSSGSSAVVRGDEGGGGGCQDELSPPSTSARTIGTARRRGTKKGSC